MNKKGLGLVFLTAIISGFSIFINKFGVKGLNPYAFTFGKNVLVAVMLFSLMLFFKDFSEIKKLSKKQWSKLVAIGFIGGSVPFLLFFKGLSITSGIKAAFIHKLMFIFIGVMAFVFLKERLSKKVILVAVLLLIGNALLLKISWTAINAGDIMIFGAMLFWAAENTLSKHTLKEVTPRIVAFGRMFFGSLFILAFLAMSGNIVHVADLHIGWMLITSLFLLGYVYTWYSGLKHVKVTVAAMVLLLGSVITTSLNYLFTGAIVTLEQAVGMGFIVVGIIAALKFSGEIKLSQLRIHNES